MIDGWYENKKRFIEWFGNDLIFEYGPVEFHLDSDKKVDLVKAFLEQASNHICNSKVYADFSEFVLANISTFFENLVSKGTETIPKGMKLSKAFKFFIQDKETLVAVQQIASSYIQQDKINGTLCLSVHPLDYLSLSENTYNWRSCHSLDGDYRAGNLSYMCDKSTIIAYIKGNHEDKVLPHFPEDLPWNSKKWRMLIYFDEDMKYCFLGRQYPYTLDNQLFETISYLLPNKFDDFTDYHINEIPDLGRFHTDQIVLRTFDGLRFFPIDEVIEDECDLHYNDLLYSHYYKPYYSSKRFNFYSKEENWKKPPKIKVGKNFRCLRCGENQLYSGEGTMICAYCASDLGIGLPSDYEYCSCCGEIINRDEGYYIANGDFLCESCLNNGDFFCCHDCGEVYNQDELIYSYKYDAYFCENCFQNIASEEDEYRHTHRLEEYG